MIPQGPKRQKQQELAIQPAGVKGGSRLHERSSATGS